MSGDQLVGGRMAVTGLQRVLIESHSTENYREHKEI